MAQQTRRDILSAARRLFAERGYVATSISDIAAEAEVAVQTIYSRLGSKRGMLIALIDLIDEEAAVGQHVQDVLSAKTPLETLTAGVRLTRAFQERCGDIIAALFSAAGAEPELADAVAEGQRRHREGAGSPSTTSINSAASAMTCTRKAPRRYLRSAPAMRHGPSSSTATTSAGTKPKPGSETP